MLRKLICEAGKQEVLQGKQIKKHGIKLNFYNVDEKIAQNNGIEAGNYISIQNDESGDIASALKYAISKLTKKSKALIVGLGNGKIMADALGDKVVEYLKKTQLNNSNLSVFAPSVGAVTNLNSVRAVCAIAREFKPDCVIAIDALATSHRERIGNMFQLSDTKLTPADGVGGGVGELSKDTLNTKFLSIGIPFIIAQKDLCGGTNEDGYVVPYDIDEKVDYCAKIISIALCEFFG